MLRYVKVQRPKVGSRARSCLKEDINTLIKTVLHNTLLTFVHHTLFFYPECRLWASSRYGGNVNMMAV